MDNLDGMRRVDLPPTPFEEAQTRTGNGIYNMLLSATCALILFAIGADLFGFSLVVAAACELNLSIQQKGILTSLPFIGIFVVSYLWGYIADTRGRRFTLVLSMGVAFVLSCLSSLSPNWIFLAVCRFFAVCFSCASHSTTYTLVGESCIQRVRGKYMLMMTSLLLLSSGGAAILAYPTLKLNFNIHLPGLDIDFKPWRLLIIVLALPSGIGALAIYFFQESPKFLANMGRKEEALAVLERIYSINHRCHKDEFKVYSLILEEESSKKDMSFIRSVYEQSAPLFRAPYVLRTFQLFYLIAVVYITNNTFLVWLPHILVFAEKSLRSGGVGPGNICTLVAVEAERLAKVGAAAANQTSVISSNDISNTSLSIQNTCEGAVEDNVLFTLVASQCVFTFLNIVLSFLQHHRKLVLLAVLMMSSIGGVGLNLMPEPISSVVFFIMFSCTCLGMGILASYFVDLYPTSYRGMVACLSIMVGRSSAFVGINVVGSLLFPHCQVTFYGWASLVFSAFVVALFLPSDKVK